jgi:hypothetical protein
LVRRDVQVWVNGQLQRRMMMESDFQTVSIPPIELVPGKNVLEIRSSVPPSRAGGDLRPLGIMVQAIDLMVLGRSPGPPPERS